MHTPSIGKEELARLVRLRIERQAPLTRKTAPVTLRVALSETARAVGTPLVHEGKEVIATTDELFAHRP